MNDARTRHFDEDEPETWSCSNEPFRFDSAVIKKQPPSARRTYRSFAETGSGWLLAHPLEALTVQAKDVQTLAIPAIREQWPGAWRDEMVRSLASTHELTHQLGAIVSNRLAVSAICDDARDLLTLPEDWDGFGSPAFQKETVKRVISLVRRLADSAERMFQVLPVPEINPADEGSIDLAWRFDSGMLLVNVPGEPEEDATFFGESGIAGTIAGEIKPGGIRTDLVAWLTQLD